MQDDSERSPSPSAQAKAVRDAPDNPKAWEYLGAALWNAHSGGEAAGLAALAVAREECGVLLPGSPRLAGVFCLARAARLAGDRDQSPWNNLGAALHHGALEDDPAVGAAALDIAREECGVLLPDWPRLAVVFCLARAARLAGDRDHEPWYKLGVWLSLALEDDPAVGAAALVVAHEECGVRLPDSPLLAVVFCHARASRLGGDSDHDPWNSLGAGLAGALERDPAAGGAALAIARQECGVPLPNSPALAQLLCFARAVRLAGDRDHALWSNLGLSLAHTPMVDRAMGLAALDIARGECGVPLPDSPQLAGAFCLAHAARLAGDRDHEPWYKLGVWLSLALEDDPAVGAAALVVAHEECGVRLPDSPLLAVVFCHARAARLAGDRDQIPWNNLGAALQGALEDDPAVGAAALDIARQQSGVPLPDSPRLAEVFCHARAARLAGDRSDHSPWHNLGIGLYLALGDDPAVGAAALDVARQESGVPLPDSPRLANVFCIARAARLAGDRSNHKPWYDLAAGLSGALGDDPQVGAAALDIARQESEVDLPDSPRLAEVYCLARAARLAGDRACHPWNSLGAVLADALSDDPAVSAAALDIARQESGVDLPDSLRLAQVFCHARAARLAGDRDFLPWGNLGFAFTHQLQDDPAVGAAALAIAREECGLPLPDSPRLAGVFCLARAARLAGDRDHLCWLQLATALHNAVVVGQAVDAEVVCAGQGLLGDQDDAVTLCTAALARAARLSGGSSWQAWLLLGKVLERYCLLPKYGGDRGLTARARAELDGDFPADPDVAWVAAWSRMVALGGLEPATLSQLDTALAPGPVLGRGSHEALLDAVAWGFGVERPPGLVEARAVVRLGGVVLAPTLASGWALAAASLDLLAPCAGSVGWALRALLARRDGGEELPRWPTFDGPSGLGQTGPGEVPVDALGLTAWILSGWLATSGSLDAYRRLADLVDVCLDPAEGQRRGAEVGEASVAAARVAAGLRSDRLRALARGTGAAHVDRALGQLLDLGLDRALSSVSEGLALPATRACREALRGLFGPKGGGQEALRWAAAARRAAREPWTAGEAVDELALALDVAPEWPAEPFYRSVAPDVRQRSLAWLAIVHSGVALLRGFESAERSRARGLLDAWAGRVRASLKSTQRIWRDPLLVALTDRGEDTSDYRDVSMRLEQLLDALKAARAEEEVLASLKQIRRQLAEGEGPGDGPVPVPVHVGLLHRLADAVARQIHLVCKDEAPWATQRWFRRLPRDVQADLAAAHGASLLADRLQGDFRLAALPLPIVLEKLLWRQGLRNMAELLHKAKSRRDAGLVGETRAREAGPRGALLELGRQAGWCMGHEKGISLALAARWIEQVPALASGDSPDDRSMRRLHDAVRRGAKKAREPLATALRGDDGGALAGEVAGVVDLRNKAAHARHGGRHGQEPKPVRRDEYQALVVTLLEGDSPLVPRLAGVL